MADADVAAYAQSIELAFVALYEQLGPLFSAATKLVTELFASHHRDHAAAFGALAGDSATGVANAAVLAALAPSIEAARSEADALEVAFTVENQAAATYAFALTVVVQPETVGVTASVLPVESEHAALLGALLGKPVGDLFPNGAFEPASVGAAGHNRTGLDPSKYPVG